MDAKVRRLAVHVEDHPLEYFDFEGVISSGNYGAGDIIVWDWGTWSPAPGGDPLQAVKQGELHVDLQGEKLSGPFMLVRTERKASRQEQWLLFRKSDEHSVAVGTLNSFRYPSKADSPTTTYKIFTQPNPIPAGLNSNPTERFSVPLPTVDNPTLRGLMTVSTLSRRSSRPGPKGRDTMTAVSSSLEEHRRLLQW